MTTLIRDHFTSVDEFCSAPFKRDDNESFCKEKFFDGREWLDDRKSAFAWLNAPSADDAAARVTKGWPEGAQRVLENLRDIDVPQPTEIRRRRVRADQGDELDIHAVYRGDLEHAWSARRRRQHHARQSVRIVAQTNILQRTSARDLFWRGAAVVKLADILTEAGYSVEIIGAMASQDLCGNRSREVCATMVVKEANTPTDVEQLAGVLCNAGFHRLFGFRAYIALADFHVDAMPGNTQSDTSGRIIAAADLGADGTPTFVCGYNVLSKERAEEWIQQVVSQLEAKGE